MTGQASYLTSKNSWFIMDEITPMTKKRMWKWAHGMEKVKCMDYAKAELQILDSVAEEIHGTPVEQEASVVVEAQAEGQGVQEPNVRPDVRRWREWTTHTRQR